MAKQLEKKTLSQRKAESKKFLKYHAFVALLVIGGLFALGIANFIHKAITGKNIFISPFVSLTIIFIFVIAVGSFFIHFGILKKKYPKKIPSKVKIGKLPVNSRITIDYAGIKPTIKFAYPKKNASYQVGNTTLVFYGAMIFALFTTLIFFMGLSLLPGYSTGYPSSCLIYSEGYQSILTNKSYVYGFKFDCIVDEKHYNMSVDYKLGKFFGLENPYFTGEQKILGLSESYFALWVGTIFFFIWRWIIRYVFLNTKWGGRSFPELNKQLLDARFSCTFKPSDIKNNQFEIPLFKNIYMDYKVTGEISKYLQKVEVVNHPFNRLVKKKGKKIRDTDIYHWKTVFTFSQTPTNGKGEVRWT